MAYSAAGKNLMLNELAGNAGFLSLHTGDPSTTGANEATGGTPSYSRQAIDWDAADAGEMDLDGTPTFDVPAGTYSHFGLWSAVSGGTFYGGGALSSSEVFADQGQYQFTEVTLDLNN